MKNTIAIFIIFLSSGLLYADDFWTASQGPYYDNEGELLPTIVKSICAAPDGSIYAGTDQNGIYKSIDSGMTWSWLNFKSQISYIYAPEGDTIFIIENGSLYESHNAGSTWSPLGAGLLPNSVSAIVKVENMLFAGCGFGQGIFVSTDSGTLWEQVNEGIDNPDIMSLHVDSENNIYAGTYFGQVYKSSNLGESWDELNTGIDFFVSAIGSDNSGNLYIASDAIYLSTNKGNRWNKVSDMQYSDYSAIVTSAQGWVYVSSLDNGGVFFSTNAGSSWTEENTGLGNQNVSTLAKDNNGYIYAGTDAGIFRGKPGGIGVMESRPNRISLYPNPATDYCIFELPDGLCSGLVHYTIYNSYAELLFSASLAPINNMIRIETSDLQPGNYYIKLSNGGQVLTQHLVVLR